MTIARKLCAITSTASVVFAEGRYKEGGTWCVAPGGTKRPKVRIIRPLLLLLRVIGEILAVVGYMSLRSVAPQHRCRRDLIIFFIFLKLFFETQLLCAEDCFREIAFTGG